MKKLTTMGVGLVALLVGSTATAAEMERDEPAAQVATEQPKRYQVAPNFGVTSVKGGVFAPTVGMRAMMGTDWETFNIGLGLTGMRFDEAEGLDALQHAVYGTLVFEWTLLRQARLHPVIDLSAGTGKYYWAGRDWKGPGNSMLVVFEPSVGAEADVTRFMRVRLSAVARGVLTPTAHSASGELSGVGGRLSLSFGRF